MNNWTYFATYQVSNSETRALPQSFSELFITQTDATFKVHFLIPQIIIPNVNNIDQALVLFNADSDYSSVLRIWSGGMEFMASTDQSSSGLNYDVYYR